VFDIVSRAAKSLGLLVVAERSVRDEVVNDFLNKIEPNAGRGFGD
jgi:hypothetical protein